MPNYEKQGSKGQALYEVMESPIDWLITFYYQFMNKELEGHNKKRLNLRKILNKFILYAMGTIFFMGPIMNMCISGYYYINKEKIHQENRVLEDEMNKIKNNLQDYGKIYGSKNIIFNPYDKISGIERFNFDCQNEEAMKTISIEVMKKNEFILVNEINKKNENVLIFRKNKYIGELCFFEDKSMGILLKKDDIFRESNLYKFLQPFIWITAPLNPLKHFER